MCAFVCWLLACVAVAVVDGVAVAAAVVVAAVDAADAVFDVVVGVGVVCGGGGV